MISVFLLMLLAAPGFASERTESIYAGGSKVTVRLTGSPALPVHAVMEWVQTAAQAVTVYYGRFPVPDVDLTIDTRDTHGGIHHGVTYRGRRITIELAHDTTTEDLARDWILTHEMFHLGFPLLDDSYDWMGEGLSDYVEPIARARIGVLSDEKVWQDLVDGLPKGLPRPADEGLDRTHTWGRIYWGGTLYWFLADLEIRRRTHLHRSLDHALRAILDAGGNGRLQWTLERVIAVGDHATGTTVLKDLHDAMGEKPYRIDLDALWNQLGVVPRDGRITFDDRAPEAALRHSVTAPLYNAANKEVL
jgi:hypothetical protein